ncbi:hypothetical protein BDM02DRAFT_3080131, partial [Thelephora ganbajun]
GKGAVSQFDQGTPFSAGYEWFNTTDNLIIPDLTITELKLYSGRNWILTDLVCSSSVFRQAISAVSMTSDNCHELNTNCYAVYGFEHQPGFMQDNVYITWIHDNKSVWTMNTAGTIADNRVNIGPRQVPQEPMV